MKTFRLVRFSTTGARLGYRFIGSALVILMIGSCLIAAGQSASRRPVARLIVDTANNSATNSTPRANGAGSSTTVTNAVISPSIEEATDTERRAFEVTNELRAKNGLAPLDWDPQLCLLARTHSRNMSVLGFFSHKTPEGLRLRDRARVAGMRYQVIAENIAYNQGYDDPGAFAVERWMISPGHRANLLGSEFRGSAIGSFIAPDGTVFLTQLFILR